jgi:hypothetical protein
MRLTSKAFAALIVLLVLWKLWCAYVVTRLTPRIEMHFTIWHGMTSWILCLLPLFAIAAVLVFRIKKGK